MLKSTACGIIPIRKNGNDEWEFLILQLVGGSWSFPKGTVEEGETPLETALRETFEEAGLGSDVFSVLEEQIFQETYETDMVGAPKDKTVTYFLGLVDGNPTVAIQKSEVQQYRWASYEEARELFKYPSRQTVIDEILATLKNLDI